MSKCEPPKALNPTTCACECPAGREACGDSCCTPEQGCCRNHCQPKCVAPRVLNPTTCACDCPPDVPSCAAGVPLVPAFEFFPGTIYDTSVTRSYAGARGTVAVPDGQGDDPPCLVVASGLRPNRNYTVSLDLNGSTRGNVGTAGPWRRLGQFTTDSGGNGQFQCSGQPASGTSIYINDPTIGGGGGTTLLISDKLP